MMRVVLDTNVLISGTFWTGASYRLIECIRKMKITLVVSQAILAEYDRILHADEIMNKNSYNSYRVRSMEKLVQSAILVESNERINVVKEDPEDNKFIEAAVAGKADVIVSQDNHLL